MIYQKQFYTAENPGFMFLPSSLVLRNTQQMALTTPNLYHSFLFYSFGEAPARLQKK